MTTLAELVDETLGLLEGYGLHLGRAAFLANPVDDTETSFVVSLGAENLDQGLAELDDELVYVQAVDRTSDNVTLSPDGRGYRGTEAVEHAANTRLTMSPTFPRALVKRKLNETIVGTYPTLQAENAHEFIASPVVYGYELPVDVEDVVSVTYDVVGPSSVSLTARHWKLDRHADPDTFASGISLMVWDHVEPGRTVRVTYRGRPRALELDDDELTDSGLDDSARAAIIWGTAWRLVSFMDPSRLSVHTVQTDLVDEANPVGRAMDISRVLRAAYDQELLDEQRRQQLRTPPKIHYEDF